MVVKACSKCGEVKSLDEYSRDKSKRDGRGTQCKTCKAEYYRCYREENLEKVLESERRYRAENLEKERARLRRYQEENRDYINRSTRRRKEKIQAATASVSNKSGRWSEVEVAILLADDGQTIAAKALGLGRTYGSCQGKLDYLRKAGAAV